MLKFPHAKKSQFGQISSNLEGQWHRVTVSDENKINLDGPKGLIFCWRDLMNKRKFSPKHSVWGDSGYEYKHNLAFL